MLADCGGKAHAVRRASAPSWCEFPVAGAFPWTATTSDAGQMGSPTFTSTRNYRRALARVVSARTRTGVLIGPADHLGDRPAGVELDAIILVERDVEHPSEPSRAPRPRCWQFGCRCDRDRWSAVRRCEQDRSSTNMSRRLARCQSSEEALQQGHLEQRCRRTRSQGAQNLGTHRARDSDSRGATRAPTAVSAARATVQSSALLQVTVGSPAAHAQVPFRPGSGRRCRLTEAVAFSLD